MVEGTGVEAFPIVEDTKVTFLSKMLFHETLNGSLYCYFAEAGHLKQSYDVFNLPLETYSSHGLGKI